MEYHRKLKTTPIAEDGVVVSTEAEANIYFKDSNGRATTRFKVVRVVPQIIQDKSDYLLNVYFLQ